MRITGGMLGGRHVEMPDGSVRPTQDKVRQALFSILATRIPGCRFLDLFAGAGTVGLEAWSRGAEQVAWVESNRRVLPVLRRNVALCQGGQTHVYACDVVPFLKKGFAGTPFDIMFADPPYEKEGRPLRGNGWQETLLDAVAAGGLLAGGGLFILEAMTGTGTGIPSGWRLTDEREYGSTLLRFFEQEETGPEKDIP